MDLAEHLRVIWRRKWRVLGVAAVLALLVYARGKTLPDQFASDATLQVTAGASSNGDNPGQETTVFLAARYARLAETDPVLEDSIRRSGLEISLDEARGRVSAVSDSEVGFITIRATGPDADEAQALATAESAALVDTIARQEQAKIEQAAAVLDPQIAAVAAELAQTEPDDPQRAALEAQYSALIQKRTDRLAQDTNRVDPVADASRPDAPYAPTPFRDAVLAFVVALILNAELWVVLELLSDRFSPDEIGEEAQRVTGLPILAEIPRGDRPEVIEAFRALRTNLMFLSSHDQVRTLAVVGIEPGCGKSHTAIGLAQAASDLELPVVLVDGDLRRPVIHQRLQLASRPGLGDLRSKEDLDRVARPVPGHPFLRVVPAGTQVADPSGLLGGGFRQVMSLISAADLIVVDTPAAGLFAEATAIAAQCDATIVVIDATATHRRALTRLVENLRRVNANPVGIVLNRVDPGPRTSYYYDRVEPGARSARS